MWRYAQATGHLRHEGQLVGMGYSGHGIGRNNYAYQQIANVGPIPVGHYTIGPPYDGGRHGPFVLPLEPDDDNEMFGRGAFLIHGDSVREPGEASLGCIIFARVVREQIARSGDIRLEVVRDDTDETRDA